MREFPPRLPQQPFFYPVANVGYARQIARDWNTRDENSAFAGFVTSFDVSSNYLSGFEPHTVGSSDHIEYWVPADELVAFNKAIQGTVRLHEAYFGEAFNGHTPEAHGLKGKNAIAQFVSLSKSWEENRADVAYEVSANPKAIFLNWLYWVQHDFSNLGIAANTKVEMLRNLKRCWELGKVKVPLPQNLNDVQD
jgi:hypothetical protein